MASSTSPEIRFAADGTVASFRKTDGGPNLVDTAQPGRGFVVRTFTGAAIDECGRIGWNSTATRCWSRAMVNRHGLRFTLPARAVTWLKLNRVEGLPAASLASLEFELNCVGTDVKALSLDYMTRVDQQGGAARVQFNYLWHRKEGDPLGGFALYAAADGADEDDVLADIWSHEDLPRPQLIEPWTKKRVAPLDRRLLRSVQGHDDDDPRRQERGRTVRIDGCRRETRDQDDLPPYRHVAGRVLAAGTLPCLCQPAGLPARPNGPRPLFAISGAARHAPGAGLRLRWDWPEGFPADRRPCRSQSGGVGPRRTGPADRPKCTGNPFPPRRRLRVPLRLRSRPQLARRV